MKKRFGWILLLAVLASPVAGVQAGWRCCSPCGTDCCVSYVEKEVTCYRAESKQRVVPVTVTKLVSSVVEEKYKYTEMVPVYIPEKRTESFWTCVPREEIFTYNVCVPVYTPVKQL